MTQFKAHEAQELRAEIESAIANVAHNHNMTYTVGTIIFDHSDNAASVDIEQVELISHSAPVQKEMSAEEIVKQFFVDEKLHAHASSRKKYKHRMIIAISSAAGIFLFYHFMHMEMVGKGLEYLMPAVVDKLIFGLGE